MNNDNHPKKARRLWSAETKLQILKEGRSGSTPLSRVCDQYEIQPPQFYQWERAADQAALEALRHHKQGRKRHTLTEEALLSEIEKLRAVIAELSAENLQLKRGRWL
jgi:transposase-like protein